MPLDFVTVPALTNGVSRQAPLLRLDSQAENQKNFLSEITGGVTDRPPASIVAAITGAALPADGFYHPIIRDEAEQYEVVIPGDGTLRVFAKDGTEQTVNAISAAAQTYLTSSGNARDAFRARTIVDNTFVTNREIDTEVDSAASAAQDNTCLMWVRQAGNGPDNVTIQMKSTYNGTWSWLEFDFQQNSNTGNGNVVTQAAVVADIADPDPLLVASVQTPSNGHYATQTTGVAQHIYRALDRVIADHVANSRGSNGNSMATWSLRSSPITPTGLFTSAQGALGSVVVLSSSDAGDSEVRFSATSGIGPDAIKVAHGSVESLLDLPATGAPPGFKIKVLEETGSDLDDWYVEYDGASWSEVVGFEVPLGFDADTMPHILRRESNGTFTFEAFSWAQRTAGDEVSNPDPGFIGKPIKNVTLYKNRLAFVYEDGVAFSESGTFSNFWATTARQLLASDPIDISIDAGSGAPRYESAVPYDQALLVWSADGQAVVQGTDIFSAETVSADLATEYEADLSLEPITTGNTFLFQAPTGTVWEYVPGSSSGTYAAIDITAHIPGYLPGDFTWAAASRAKSLVIFGSASNRNKLYAYRYFYDSGDKIQSSWSEWELNEDIAIHGGDFFGDELILFADVDTDENLTTTRMMLNLDFNPTPPTGFSDPIYLDVMETVTVGAGAYSSAFNYTTVTIPYDIDLTDGYVAVLGDGAGVRFGEVLPGAGATSTLLLYLAGEVPQGTEVHLGRTYDRVYEPSKFVLRSPSRDNRSTPQPVTNARVQVRRVRAELGRTGYLRAEISRDGTKFSEKVFTPAVVGGPAGFIPPVDSGTFEFSVGANAEGLSIQLINDTFLPSELLSISYEALYHNRSVRTR